MSATVAHALPEIKLLAPAELLHSTATEFGSSRYAERQRCGMAYELKYNRRILPVYRPSYFGVGSLVHAGLRQAEQGAALGLELDWREPIRVAREIEAARIGAMNALEEGELDRPDSGFGMQECDEAERLLGAYFTQHGEINAGWPMHLQVVALELQLSSTTLGEPLTGAIDTLLLNRDSGDLIIVDTKTSASRVPGSLADPEKRDRWKRGQAVRPQFLMQSWMLQEQLNLPEPASFIVNHISKAKLPICEKVPILITPEALANWELNQRLLNSLGPPPAIRNYSACAPSIGEQCAYFEYCHGSEQSRTNRFKREDQT